MDPYKHYAAVDVEGRLHVGDKETVELETGNKAAPISDHTYEHLDDYTHLYPDVINHSGPTADEVTTSLDWQ